MLCYLLTYLLTGVLGKAGTQEKVLKIEGHGVLGEAGTRKKMFKIVGHGVLGKVRTKLLNSTSNLKFILTFWCYCNQEIYSQKTL